MLTIFLILAFINWRNFFGSDLPPYRPQYDDLIGIAMLTVTGLTIISGLIYTYENRELILNLLRKLFRM